MIALLNAAIATLVTASVTVMMWQLTVRLVARGRLHQQRANRRFLARYRAEHPKICRPTVEAPPPGALPVIRRRTPVGADRVPPRSPAPAGPTTEYREHQGLQRLADLRNAGGWQFTMQDTALTGVHPWPDGSADLLVVRDFTAAQARRTNEAGAVVWRQEGDVSEIVDALLRLPAPDQPDAPTRAIEAGPDVWTSG